MEYKVVKVITANARLTGIADTKLILVLPASTASEFPTADFFDQANSRYCLVRPVNLRAAKARAWKKC